MVGVFYLEFFLVPGTIILTDGRSANAEFLEKILKESGYIIGLKVNICLY